MNLSFSPVRSDATLILSRKGDVLTLNGREFDFSDLKKGQSLDRSTLDSDWFAEDPWRDGKGRLHVTVILPHGPDAPLAALHPEALSLRRNGPVPLPGV